MSVDELETEIRNLPEAQRELLLKRLSYDRQDAIETDSAVEELQNTEARRRYEDIVEGRVKTVSGAAVLQHARAMLNENP